MGARRSTPGARICRAPMRFLSPLRPEVDTVMDIPAALIYFDPVSQVAWPAMMPPGPPPPTTSDSLPDPTRYHRRPSAGIPSGAGGSVDPNCRGRLGSEAVRGLRIRTIGPFILSDSARRLGRYSENTANRRVSTPVQNGPPPSEPGTSRRASATHAICP